MPDSVGPTEGETRNHRRSRVLKQGKILVPATLMALDCGVRDVSEVGARLTGVDTSAVPDGFRLVLAAERTMREAFVVWRTAGELGVRFTSPPRRAPLLKW